MQIQIISLEFLVLVVHLSFSFLNKQTKTANRQKDKRTNTGESTTSWRWQKLVIFIILECSIIIPLGFQSKEIKNGRITASTYMNGRWPHQARIGQSPITSWNPNTGDVNPWIQVDLIGITTVKGITTQGRMENNKYWIKTYKVSYGYATDALVDYKVNGTVKVKSVARFILKRYYNCTKKCHIAVISCLIALQLFGSNTLTPAEKKKQLMVLMHMKWKLAPQAK